MQEEGIKRPISIRTQGRQKEIIQLYAENNGVQAEVARRLGISVTALTAFIDRYDLKPRMVQAHLARVNNTTDEYEAESNLMSLSGLVSKYKKQIAMIEDASIWTQDNPDGLTTKEKIELSNKALDSIQTLFYRFQNELKDQLEKIANMKEKDMVQLVFDIVSTLSNKETVRREMLVMLEGGGKVGDGK